MNKDISCTVKRAMERKEEPRSLSIHNYNKIAHQPYIQCVTNRIPKVIRRKESATYFKLLETIKQKIKPIKDTLNHHQCKRVYKVKCSCGKCNIREIGHSFHVKIKEHGTNIKNKCACTLTLIEYSLINKHHVYLKGTKILTKKYHYFKHQIREVMKIIKHPNNLNE
jgi:hypothetical protein